MSEMFIGPDGRPRCSWCGGWEPYVDYHDREWGRPVADDRRLFEKLCLEGFQSGLSWRTILAKRENFRAAFAGFEIDAVAAFGPDDVERLLADAGIERHRGKIEAVINNARRACEMIEAEGALAPFLWSFAPEGPSDPARGTAPESVALSKALKKKGWKFVGPTTVYAFMQSEGMVNDHLPGCHVHAQTAAEQAAFRAANGLPPQRV